MRVATIAALVVLLWSPSRSFAESITVDNSLDTLDVVDPMLFELAANPSATDLPLSTWLGHWKKIGDDSNPPSALNVDLGTGVLPDCTVPNPDLPTPCYGAPYWNLQDIVNDTGRVINTLYVSEYTTVNVHQGTTSATQFSCGGGANPPPSPIHFANCTISILTAPFADPVVGGDKVVLALWTFSGGPGVPVGGHFQLSLRDTGVAWPGDVKITVAPEPGSWLLFGSGLLGLALRRFSPRRLSERIHRNR
jgi:hypothetical protein